MAYLTTNITIGTGVLGVAYPDSYGEFSTPNTLLTSYADIAEIIENDPQTPTLNWQGMPISVSQFYSSELEISSGDQSGYYFAIDVIKNTDIVEKTSDLLTTGIAQHATWNGNKIQISYGNDLYFLNVIDLGTTVEAENRITFQGTPQATGTSDELVINDSGFTTVDIELDPNTGEVDIKSISLGGVPISVGRIGFKYYLIVNEVLEP